MSSLEHQDSATAQTVRRPARAELVGSMVRPANDATEIQWEKIDVMCRVADRVWGRA